MKNRIIDTDVLIIGGGTAGCFAGITLGKKKDLDVLIVERQILYEAAVLRQALMQLMLISLRAESHRIMLIIVRKMQME